MAGSLKDVIYEDDQGNDWIVRMDESNAEYGGFADYTGGEGEPTNYLPSNITMRYVNWVSNDGKLRRQFPVGTPGDAIFTGGGNLSVAVLQASSTLEGDNPTAPATTLYPGGITSAVGERRKFPRSRDSGVDDGDNT